MNKKFFKELKNLTEEDKKMYYWYGEDNIPFKAEIPGGFEAEILIRGELAFTNSEGKEVFRGDFLKPGDLEGVNDDAELNLALSREVFKVLESQDWELAVKDKNGSVLHSYDILIHLNIDDNIEEAKHSILIDVSTSQGGLKIENSEKVKVGDRVFIINGDYSGCSGVVNCIKTGKEKETENENDDYYVELEEPECKVTKSFIESGFKNLKDPILFTETIFNLDELRRVDEDEK